MPDLSQSYHSCMRFGRHQKPTAIYSLFAFFLVVLFVMLPVCSSRIRAGQEEIFVIPVHETIDLGLAFFMKRSLSSAEQGGAEYIVLDVNTFGGRVDAAVDIRDALDKCEIPTAAYVNKRAISAGALICLATETIAMAPGSTIGAATPVGIGPGGGKLDIGEKEVSYVRAEFRATAEDNGHSPLLAEAMVDADTEIAMVFDGEDRQIVSASEAEKERESGKEVKSEVISPKGKLLTMTAEEAVKVGLAESTPETLDELIRSLGFKPSNKRVARVSWSENIVRFLTNPIVAGLLLTLGVLGIFFELQMPGWGISGSLGTLLLVLFFGGHYLAGLANFVDVLLFMIGLVLLALEIFVVPGFGVTGISGLICILVGIYLALVKRPLPRFSWEYQSLDSALITFVLFLAAIPIGIVIIWKVVPDSRFKNILVLSASERGEDGYIASDNLETLIGKSGMSLSHLRPAGRAMIAGEPMEVQTEGDFIEKDRTLKVVRVMGNKVFVAEAEKEKDEGSS